MLVKVRASFIFGNAIYRNAFNDSILGTPVVDDNRQRIGLIVGYDKDKELLELEIEDDYKQVLESNEICSMEVVHD